jgi:hypothetical protein
MSAPVEARRPSSLTRLEMSEVTASTPAMIPVLELISAVKFTQKRHFLHERRRGSNLVTSGVNWLDLIFQLHCRVAGLRLYEREIRQTWKTLAPNNKKGGANCRKFPERNFTVNIRFSVLFVSTRIKKTSQRHKIPPGFLDTLIEKK